MGSLNNSVKLENQKKGGGGLKNVTMKRSHCSQARMANRIIVEHHFKTLRKVSEGNELLNKHSKIFNTDESGNNTDLRQGKVAVSCSIKQVISQSKGLMI